MSQTTGAGTVQPAYVNVGAFNVRIHFNNTKSAPSHRNCEFCTAAGAVALVLGTVTVNSGDAANAAGLIDTAPDPRQSGGIDKQAERIASFVHAKTGRTGVFSDGNKSEQPYAAVDSFMKACKDGTVFAVYVAGPYITESDGSRVSHWLNAVKKPGKAIVYYDFQTNRKLPRAYSGMSDFKGALKPAKCSAPFVGYVTQLAACSADADLRSNNPNRQLGMIDLSTASMLVVAFSAD